MLGRHGGAKGVNQGAEGAKKCLGGVKIRRLKKNKKLKKNPIQKIPDTEREDRQKGKREIFKPGEGGSITVKVRDLGIFSFGA